MRGIIVDSEIRRIEDSRTGPARRTLLLGAGAAGAIAVLAACAGGGSGASGDTATATGNATVSNDLGKASDIVVGSGRIFPDQLVVVTQPTEGDFKAFTATCTHMQCTVNKIENGQIVCPCHGSRYSINDGSVIQGPAPKPLAAKTIKVVNGEVTLG
jgi:Rieske Fe-S protein